MTSPAFDVMDFRKALGTFVTGVTVVTTIGLEGEPRGFTANSFSSVSLDPPLILVCVAKTASSFPIFSTAGHFAVNVLAEHQKPVSSVFASKRPDKFSEVGWSRGRTGSPLIAEAAAWFDCESHDVVEAGDHVILIGRVLEFGHSPASPLGYCRGAYLTFSLSQDAVAAAGQRTRVGAILERDGGIVFVERHGRLELPTGGSLEPASDPASLKGVLASLGLDARLGFLFAVFEDTRSAGSPVSIYYRGTLESDPPGEAPIRIVPLADIPWERLPDEAVRVMLRRFVKERSEDAFGIYVGDTQAGTVQALARPA